MALDKTCNATAVYISIDGRQKNLTGSGNLNVCLIAIFSDNHFFIQKVVVFNKKQNTCTILLKCVMLSESKERLSSMTFELIK